MSIIDNNQPWDIENFEASGIQNWVMSTTQ